jgi:two-component system NtrC family sensor kinase
MAIVYTVRDNCKACYACIRDCPVKAISVKEGKAEVIDERCINCGNCIKICAVGAKQVESHVKKVEDLLKQHPKVIALLSSAFPAAMPEVNAGQLISALKELGFSEVMEDAFGAELISREYARLAKKTKGKAILSSNCPAVVSYIEKYHPQLIGNLAPVVSSTIAMGRVIKWRYAPEAKVVFIGPCVARKAESKYDKAGKVIDAVLTFDELRKMFATHVIKPESKGEGQFSGPRPNLGRLISTSGGLLGMMGMPDDLSKHEVISAHGQRYVVQILSEFAKGAIDARFISLYSCHGCIDGPGINNDLSTFRREGLVIDYAKKNADPAQTEKDVPYYINVSFNREFTPQSVTLHTPAAEDVQKVLVQLNKEKPEEQLNCGGCGYRTCRELAVAVCQGLAQADMCWPHVINKLQTAQEGMIQAEKITSLGQLAASVAHEINNPLGGVLVYTQLLSKKIRNNEYSREAALDYLSKMETELTRSTKLVHNLLDFSRQSPPRFWELDIHEVINRAYDLTTHSAQLQHVKVIKEYSPSLPKIWGDFDQLQQVFTNLLMNAIEASPDGGDLTIHSHSAYGQVIIEVSDQGAGISPENMRKLFTPFFTTKREIKGVGLGLAISYGIIQRHHGKIEVQSKEGKGTTFTISLPVHNEESS